MTQVCFSINISLFLVYSLGIFSVSFMTVAMLSLAFEVIVNVLAFYTVSPQPDSDPESGDLGELPQPRGSRTHRKLEHLAATL